jgi:hypothetical protein
MTNQISHYLLRPQRMFTIDDLYEPNRFAGLVESIVNYPNILKIV